MTDPIHELRQQLGRVPVAEVAPSTAILTAIDDSVRYLGSEEALASIDADTYWPKWDSPWWHMLALHEVGEARRIPARAVQRMIDGINALPIRVFPIHPEDSPPGADPHRDSSCHCALGCLYQVLAASGVDVDAALPWVKPWFVRYQMADGGLNCDADAYLVSGETPSSMVGTISPFEAMLLGEWTPDQLAWLERAAQFLAERQLMLGSSSRHNAEERVAQEAWQRLCFPRFYFYDVLRGLRAFVRWMDVSGRALPWSAVSTVTAQLVAAFPDGVVRRGRRGSEGVKTMARSADGTWSRGHLATVFPLLEATSSVGEPCPYLTRDWTATRQVLVRMIDEGRVAP